MTDIRRINATQLKGMLSDGAELALLDVREAGQFGESHLLFATPLPYSRLEVDIGPLVPRKSARLVVCDDGVLGVAERAAKRLIALGYSDVALLDGGNKGWSAAGYTLFAGVNVPSKTFGELVEHAYQTPRVTVQELVRMKEAGEDFVILDGRPFAEYQKMSIPGGVCCPNAELPYRVSSMVKNPHTKIIVNCAGRTRSILGAQTLISFGVSNPVYALENGTQGWVLANHELERGADRRYPDAIDPAVLPELRSRAQALMERFKIGQVDARQVEVWLRDSSRTTYLCDVRTPEEFKAGSLPGAVHAPGGQLVQATDQWVGVRNARVVLLDSEGVRAPVVASWLKQLGCNVYVLDQGIRSGLTGPSAPAPALPSLPPITAGELRRELDAGRCAVFYLGASMAFRKAHIPGSRWSIRPRIAADARDALETMGRRGTIALLADDTDTARLGGAELLAAGFTDIRVLLGGLDAWIGNGGKTASSPETPPDADCIDFLFFVHDRHAGNRAAMQQYLDWETGLLEQLDEQDKASFDIPTAAH